VISPVGYAGVPSTNPRRSRLKRIILIATAVAMLIGTAVAFAATPVNTYKATYSFSPSSSGTAKKPQKVKFTQKINVTPGTSGDRAGILLNIKTTIYGLKVDGKDFPTCTLAQINSAGTDAGCPKGAQVATGGITALLGSPSNPVAAGALSCDPQLDVWNAGQGKLAFFFVDTAAHPCADGAIHTGQVPPYPATYKNVGKNLVVNVPIPKTVDYPAAGLVGSLQSETLNWAGQTSKGHTSIASVACKGSKRTYSTAFTATPIAGGASQTSTVSGSAPCKASK
jgi:hypothetical protein